MGKAVFFKFRDKIIGVELASHRQIVGFDGLGLWGDKLMSEKNQIGGRVVACIEQLIQ